MTATTDRALSTDAAASQRLPSCTEQLAAFHRAFGSELTVLVNSLPIHSRMRILDVGCGDGFFTALLAARLTAPGAVVGYDRSQPMLSRAARGPQLDQAACTIEFVAGDISELSARCHDFDFVWCAQSLYSLPDPVDAVREMCLSARPGGIVAVLENDTLHQVLLPWPGEVELAIRAAEYAAFAAESRRPYKFYVGRRLPGVLAAAALEPLGFRTQSIDRQAPLDADLKAFLQCYLGNLARRVGPYLTARTRVDLERLIDPNASSYLLAQAHFTMSWLNVLAWGRRPNEDP